MPARLKWLRSIVVRLPAGNITTRVIAKGIFGCGVLGVSRRFGAGFLSSIDRASAASFSTS
jgi:hypothetical protein